MDALRQIDEWSATHVAAGVATAQGPLAAYGETERVFPWASVTKPCTALAVLVAAEEGIVDLDEPAGPEGSTVRHLLAHASGLPLHGLVPITRPGRRRIYSNTGFEVLGALVAERAEMVFKEYLRAAVFEPLGAGAELRGSAGSDVHGTLDDLLRVGSELLAPTIVARETLDEATSVAFPGLTGVLPGFGRADRNDWGLGFEIKDEKKPHWTGSGNSPRTFGHFGATGTFLWVDPEPGLACAVLTDLDFGGWSKRAWPGLSDAVLAEAATSGV